MAALPVTIDYPAALALRADGARSGQNTYLLAPEVSALLHYVPDCNRKMPLEIRAFVKRGAGAYRGDFSLAPPYPFVQLATLKQRPKGRPEQQVVCPPGSQAHRLGSAIRQPVHDRLPSKIPGARSTSAPALNH